MAGYIDTVYDKKVRPRTDYPRELAEYLIRRFGLIPGARLLDAGCGRGDFLRAFADAGIAACGLDREPAGAKTAEGIAVKYADLEKDSFPFSDGTFDVVFSKSVLEHLFNPEKFMAECRRVLKPGGRIIILTPDWVSQMKIFFDDYTHRQPYTPSGLKDLLDIFEFKNTAAELFYQLPVVWKYPALKIFSRLLQFFVPVTLKVKNKFVRWSVELMILGTGVK